MPSVMLNDMDWESAFNNSVDAYEEEIKSLKEALIIEQSNIQSVITELKKQNHHECLRYQKALEDRDAEFLRRLNEILAKVPYKFRWSLHRPL